MKRLILLAISTMLLAACAPAPTPTPISPAVAFDTPTSLPPTATPVPPTATPTPLPPTSTPTPEPTDTPSPLPPTFTPTPTETPIPPPPTATPAPPQLDYTVSIDHPETRTAHVRLTMRNLRRNAIVLTFWTNAGQWYGDWLNPENNVSNSRATTPAGHELQVIPADDGISWTGDGIRIDACNEAEVVLDYDVKFGFVDRNFHGDREQLMAGYMNSAFGIAEPEFIFYAPNDVEIQPYVMTIAFTLPQGWTSVTHWQRIAGENYLVNAQDKEFANGAIAVGQLQVQERRIGQTDLRVAAYSVSSDTFGMMADRTFALYAYFNDAFGQSPTPGFALIYYPDVVDDKYLVPYNEQAGGFFTRYLDWYETFWSDNIAHPICHNWIGGTIWGVQWFQEGFTNYYELKSCQEVGIYPTERVQAELTARLERYRKEILGTPNDISLEKAAEIYNRDHGFPYQFLTYEKGSLFAYLLDLLITGETEGQKDLDDVIKHLF